MPHKAERAQSHAPRGLRVESCPSGPRPRTSPAIAALVAESAETAFCAYTSAAALVIAALAVKKASKPGTTTEHDRLRPADHLPGRRAGQHRDLRRCPRNRPCHRRRGHRPAHAVRDTDPHLARGLTGRHLTTGDALERDAR